ncbi:hypothetical protein GCM10027277_19510 [Pseudoduganella ginsengisoli]|uniref:DUF4214 domain-containing protein n=1 Tax=Pseudoduganella ginsengisoli TaxID=1462440 RepID=A0A6L6PTF0_9BURK|nr:DUF4214 domain-containing protein [Pseudoduganella ginsengisoli]MTW00793.1 DUF4214 domain-containing protein [Pseudoduganella ginsengisoli]
MPSPSSASTTTKVAQTSQLIINALLAGEKWGGAAGTGVMLTYSFPWADSGFATFSGPDSNTAYSEKAEQNAATASGLTAVQQTAAVRALDAWASVANLTFTKSADTSATVGDIRFAWSSNVDPNSSAWAYYPDATYPSGGDVWLSAGNAPTVAGTWNVGDYNFYTLLHEIGHALGFKHSFEDTPVLTGAQDTQQYTVMSYTNGAHSKYGYITTSGNSRTYHTQTIVPDTPMVDDIAAIQYLYGANTRYKTGNDTYTFDPATPFMRTLWDAGGTDTISVANFTKGCMIDLQAGHYSKITIESASTDGFNFSGSAPVITYDGTDNLGIAFGCVIENAVGGSGNDILIGNDANNNLTGGAGDDTLDGGAGSDTASFSGLSTAATITYDAVTTKARIVTAGGGADTLTNIEFAAFSDKVVDLRTLGGADVTAPTVLTFNPVDGATGIALNSHIALTFSETVKRGTGTLQLQLVNGTLVESFDAATSSRLIVSGSTLTVDPTATLMGDQQYKLVLAAGSFTDLAGNSYAGTNTYDFKTRSAPAAQSGAIIGTAGDDDLLGGSGNDTVTGSTGSDWIDGGGGLDVVRYAGARSAFTASRSGDNFLIDKAGGGTDVLTHVERVQFNDGAIAFDTGSDGVAGKAYRMYQAVFDRAPDQSGLGFWINTLDQGISLTTVASGFVSSDEFAARYGGANPTNIDFISKLYNNILHRAPEQTGFEYWLDVLTRNLSPRAQVLADFSESSENQAMVIGSITNGVHYIPYTG